MTRNALRIPMNGSATLDDAGAPASGVREVEGIGQMRSFPPELDRSPRTADRGLSLPVPRLPRAQWDTGICFRASLRTQRC